MAWRWTSAAFGISAISAAAFAAQHFWPRPEGALMPPSVAALQMAYDREAATARQTHDGDLKIVGVDCHPGEHRQFLCQVGFVKMNDDPDRVYLDAALVEHRPPGDWKLLRGLCRRLI